VPLIFLCLTDLLTMLLNPLETVSVVLGHRKLAITEKQYARLCP
jgi:hypothetical protein